MSENLRSIEEIKKAIADYLKMTIEEFDVKYSIKDNAEAKGFIKGLRWVLKL